MHHFDTGVQELASVVLRLVILLDIDCPKISKCNEVENINC